MTKGAVDTRSLLHPLSERDFILLATAVQAAAAFIQIPEPGRSMVFFSIVGVVLLWAVHRYSGRRMPPTFIAGIVLAMLVYVGASPAGRQIITDVANPTIETRGWDLSSQSPARASVRFLQVTTFLDADRDGRYGDNDEPIAGIAVEISDGDIDGLRRMVNTRTGTSAIFQHPTTGVITVSACGVSQGHVLGRGQGVADNPLVIQVGVTDEARPNC